MDIPISIFYEKVVNSTENVNIFGGIFFHRRLFGHIKFQKQWSNYESLFISLGPQRRIIRHNDGIKRSAFKLTIAFTWISRRTCNSCSARIQMKNQTMSDSQARSSWVHSHESNETLSIHFSHHHTVLKKYDPHYRACL